MRVAERVGVFPRVWRDDDSLAPDQRRQQGPGKIFGPVATVPNEGVTCWYSGDQHAPLTHSASLIVRAKEGREKSKRPCAPRGTQTRRRKKTTGKVANQWRRR